jgi:hypothetical protein
VPAGQAGQGGQSAQPGGQQGSVVAAGAAASKQQQGGASNAPAPQNQVQKWEPAPAAPAAAGRPAAQGGTAFKCRVPTCGNQNHHYLVECLVFRAMNVTERWDLVNNQKFCELCLKHSKNSAFPCNLAKAAGGPPPCGESGCTAFHHPALHVQRTGWSGVHGGVYITAKGDSEEADAVITSDFSEEPVVDLFKQGAGDMRACGLNTFFYVDSSKNHGEVFPFTAVGCATPNANEDVEIASKENAESA